MINKLKYKLLIWKATRQARKKINKQKQKIELEANERLEIEKAILDLTEVFDITNEKTKEEITKENIKEMTNKEVLEILENAIEELKKIT